MAKLPIIKELRDNIVAWWDNSCFCTCHLLLQYGWKYEEVKPHVCCSVETKRHQEQKSIEMMNKSHELYLQQQIEHSRY